MKFKVLLAVTVAFAVSAPAMADDTGKDTAQEAPKEKKICRTETVTGSIIAKRRTCLTKDQWAQLEEANRASVDRYTSRQSGRPGDQTNPAAPGG